MSDTMVTVVGNVATNVEFRETVTGSMARFRFAATARRWDREKQLWTDGHTNFYTVFAWRALAANLAGSVAVGEPLVVHGRLKVREEERDGQRRTFVDIEAFAVGHDLSRGTAAFRRVLRADPSLTERGGREARAARETGVRETGVREADRAREEEGADRAREANGAQRADGAGDTRRTRGTTQRPREVQRL